MDLVSLSQKPPHQRLTEAMSIHNSSWVFKNCIKLKGAVSVFWGVSQMSKSLVWIDLILDKDYSDIHKNAQIAILADLQRVTILLT